MSCNCDGTMRRGRCKTTDLKKKECLTPRFSKYSNVTAPRFWASNDEKIQYLFTIFESFYNKCAGYNLRYCPFRTYSKNNKLFVSTVKDLVIIACFLIANFVVFLNIIRRTAMHLYFLTLHIFTTLKRCCIAGEQDTLKTLQLTRSLPKSELDTSFLINLPLKQTEM